ncbi:ROK family protein [Paenibacillus ginsengihumi]|uniref:ROK family protein n=1 Tax=Paenibacillus ginsengihumi TaxID=431596 RepID=UPI00037A84D5|nr:ROK family protein [Paenibacillus ginsengihumi]
MERKAIEERIGGRKAKDIYELIRRQGTVSKQELLEQSGLTGSTLTRTLEDLSAQGLILEAGFGDSTGGRRPILYETNPAYGYVFGLDISRVYSRLNLYDLHLNRLESERWVMTEDATPDKLLADIVRSAKAMLQRRGLRPQDVIGMGIGAVGPIDRSAGTILEPLHFAAPGWNHIPIVSRLEDELGFPALLDNGANTAIIGEWWADREREYRHLLYVHVGVGLRSSMMTGGKIVYGAVDMEGSVGQMIIQTNGDRLRNHGNYGSLESYVSVHALEEQARSRLKQGRDSLLRELEPDPDKISYMHLEQALQSGDPLAAELFTQAATYFGIGLANLLNVLHPEKVVLGGTLIGSHPSFFHTATRVAIRNTYHYPKYQVVFSLGRLGDEALAAGAATMVINRMTEQ